jgi:hypothetical protein
MLTPLIRASTIFRQRETNEESRLEGEVAERDGLVREN